MENAAVELYHRDGISGEVVRGLNIGITREGVHSGIGDTSDVTDFGIKSRQDFVPSNLSGREIFWGLPMRQWGMVGENIELDTS